MQVADYLEAPIEPYARAICRSLTRGNSAAVPTWARLKQEPTALRAAIVACHPVLAGSSALADRLRTLPKCLGLYAVKSAVTSEAKSTSGSHRAVLELDLRSSNAVKEVAALLPAMTDLGRLISAEEPANARAQQRAHKDWPALFAAVCASLPQLGALQFRLNETPGSAMDPLGTLRSLVELTMECEDFTTADIQTHVAPALAQLTQLRRLHLHRVGLISMPQQLSMAPDGTTTPLFSRPMADHHAPGVAHGLSQLRNLEMLSLEGFTAPDFEGKAIASALRQLSNLRQLQVVCPHFCGHHSTAAFQAAADAIAALQALTKLDVCGWHDPNIRGPGGGQALVARAAGHLRQLRSLDIANSSGNLDSSMYCRSAQALSVAKLDILRALHGLCGLQLLDISGYGTFASAGEAQAAGELLAVHTALTSLKCGHEPMTSGSVANDVLCMTSLQRSQGCSSCAP